MRDRIDIGVWRVRAAVLVALVVAVTATVGCVGGRVESAAVGDLAPVVIEPVFLPLTGPIADPKAEISALCWYGSSLVLVPQHPEWFGDERDELGLFVLDRADIEAAIATDPPLPLAPRRAVLEAAGLIDSIPGWDGIEAAVARNDTVFLAIEARDEGRMAGFLLRARISDGDDGLRLVAVTEKIARIAVPTDLPNMSQEALVLDGDRIAVLYEANGKNVNARPHVALFDLDLVPCGTLPLEPIEYRITDASQPLPDGTFWVINYLFPGDARFLAPPTPCDHPVEQLLELRFTGDRVARSGTAPLDLRFDPEAVACNWEGLVRLGDHGFLIASDRYPTTLLAYIPLPGAGTTKKDER